jgi:O-glycosyl hydrolase
MIMRIRGAWWLIASVLVVAGCGGSNSVTTTQAALAVNSVTPASGSTGVAVTTPITATFNQVMNAATFNSSTFTLTGAGAPAVTGNISYSAGSSMATFIPASPLAYNTVYTATITTGVQNTSGTALGSSDTWSFTTAAGPAPTITSFTPGNGSTGVVANTTVTATFSEAMKASTITASTFTLAPQGGSAVAATVSYNATSFTATLTPSAPLTPSTTYTATITTGAVAATGSAIANNNSFSFTTAAGTVPTVTSVTPAGGSNGVAITSTAAAVFSEAMDPSTITGSTFTLTPQGGAPVSASLAFSATNVANDTVTLTPSAPLAYNTTYTALITTGALAASTTLPEVPLAADYSWSFTTAPPPLATVSAVTPTSGSTGVAIATTVTATFGSAMTASTISTSTFTLTGSSGAVAGTVSYNATTNIATFTPTASLAYGATYTATIGVGATDSAGGALAAPYTWNFTTLTGPVPTVTSTVPATGATNVNAAAQVTATFSQAMTASTINSSTFTLTPAGGSVVAATVTYNGVTHTATLTPAAALASSVTYTATITTGAQSTEDAALASNYTWTFTTGASPSAVTVNFGTTYQTIAGFGGSTAWLGQMPTAVATALFSPTSGLNLNILRVRIDPEGSAAGGGAHNLPYETSEWDYEAANGKEAVTANPNAIVFATPWTPPAAWKLNGSSSVVDDGETWNQSFNSCSEGTGYCGGYLNPVDYADYASYLEDFVSFFNTTNGFNLYAISMQNEPEENVTYESCVWTPEEMDTWVADDAATITSDPYSTKLMMPESDVFNPVDAAATLNDPNAQGLVSIIGGHIYGGPPNAPYPIPAGDTAKQVWMTEFGPLSSAQLTFTEALSPYAIDIHDSLVNGNLNAFVWWGLFGTAVNSCSTAAGTCGLVDSRGNLTVVGDIIGQYSKFIQPGYVRASASAGSTTGVYVSAYTGMQSGTQHYVIVAINNNTTAQNVNISLYNAPTSITSMTPTQSTSAAGLVPEPAVTVTGGQFYYSLPAQSIVTFVQ